MKFTIARDELLKPLQLVCSVVERRKTLPILSNVMVKVTNGRLALTATDLEVELIASTHLEEASQDGTTTVPGRKFLDICRSLPEDTPVRFSFQNDRVTISAGRSRFTLTTLSAADFPAVEDEASSLECTLPQKDLRFLIERTHFSMAQQDVRYFLNGLLLEMGGGVINAVATDGHRLSMSSVSNEAINVDDRLQVIVTRKGVVELLRLLTDENETVDISIGPNHLRATTSNIIMTSKLIDGKYPDYNSVMPKDGDKIVTIDCEMLKQTLTRVAILSNEKYRGVRMLLRNNQLCLSANNPEQEEAEEELEISYDGADLDIGFNVTYVQEVLNNIPTEQVRLTFSDPNNSVLLEEVGNDNSVYVVMPMRL